MHVRLLDLPEERRKAQHNADVLDAVIPIHEAHLAALIQDRDRSERRRQTAARQIEEANQRAHADWAQSAGPSERNYGYFPSSPLAGTSEQQRIVDEEAARLQQLAPEIAELERKLPEWRRVAEQERATVRALDAEERDLRAQLEAETTPPVQAPTGGRFAELRAKVGLS